MAILVIEDTTFQRINLVSKLEQLGYEVYQTETDTRKVHMNIQKQAERIMTAKRPDIIFADIDLGNADDVHIDGITLVVEVLKQMPEYKPYVIMCSSSIDLGNFAKARAQGIQDFIAKPIDTDVLAAKLLKAQLFLAKNNGTTES